MFFVFFWFILFDLGFIIAETNITGKVVTGEAVTGKALQSSLAMNITVTVPIPIITILSPKNGTYLTNQSLFINYLVTNANSLWYNLDSGSNITLTGPLYLNVSQGSHTIYVYANNSYGSASENNVSFIANSTFFLIFYEEYKDSTKGNSTDFTTYTYEDLQSLNGIVLENTNYGKIRFNEEINLTDDRLNTDNILDLDSNTQISFNKIQLNSEELPNFNTSATIWLYNLTLTDPAVVKDGVACPSTVCIKESYAGGILKFYVTHFTNYSAVEASSLPPDNDSEIIYINRGGGGGGGGATQKEIIQEIIREIPDNFTFIPNELSVSLVQGEADIKDIYLINNYDNPLEATLMFSGLEEFLKVNELKFTLAPGEMRAIKLNFSIPQNTPPDTYVGRVVVKEPLGRTYESFITLDVQSVSSLFDVALQLDESKLPASPGKDIFFKSIIYNLGEKEIDISIRYTIKDSAGKVIFEGEAADSIEKYLEKDGKIKLQNNIAMGKYVLSVKVSYGEKMAVASASFDVGKKSLSRTLKFLIAAGIVILVLLILWIIGKKEEKRKRKEKEKKQENLNED